MRRSPSAEQFLTIEVHQVLAGQDGERLGSVVMYMHGRPEAVRFALGPQEGELTGGISAGGQHGGAEAAEIQIPFPVRGARPVRASVNRGSRPAHDEARSVACRRPGHSFAMPAAKRMSAESTLLVAQRRAIAMHFIGIARGTRQMCAPATGGGSSTVAAGQICVLACSMCHTTA
jgi:hypothetical protein